jgi:hypothetical protein
LHWVNQNKIRNFVNQYSNKTKRKEVGECREETVKERKVRRGRKRSENKREKKENNRTKSVRKQGKDKTKGKQVRQENIRNSDQKDRHNKNISLLLHKIQQRIDLIQNSLEFLLAYYKDQKESSRLQHQLKQIDWKFLEKPHWKC